MSDFWRVCVWMFLASTVSPVICQDKTVEGFLGENVQLPCFYNKTLPVDVFWRDRYENRVWNIEGNEGKSLSSKHMGRVSSFPDKYKNGNFSIDITNLTVEDSGLYKCYIFEKDVTMNVMLKVSEKREEEVKSTPHPSGGAAGRNLLHVVLLSALCLLLCF